VTIVCEKSNLFSAKITKIKSNQMIILTKSLMRNSIARMKAPTEEIYSLINNMRFPAGRYFVGVPAFSGWSLGRVCSLVLGGK